MKKRILVYLANGVQGGAVARQAIARGHAVRALVRDPSKSDPLVGLGAEIVQADLQQPDTLIAAHRDVDHVVLQIPLGPPAQTINLVENAIAAVKSNRIESLIVKMASARPSIQTDEPSFVANEIIFEKIRQSGLRFAI